MTTKLRTYTELSKLETFEERYEYLRLDGVVGSDTFGFDRYINQMLYTSKEGRQTRYGVIYRDQGCDLGVPGHEISDIVIKGKVYKQKIIIHHMNPISVEDILHRIDYVLNPEYLISTILLTHNAIHYGDIELIKNGIVERSPNDTCPWKK